MQHQGQDEPVRDDPKHCGQQRAPDPEVQRLADRDRPRHQHPQLYDEPYPSHDRIEKEQNAGRSRESQGPQQLAPGGRAAEKPVTDQQGDAGPHQPVQQARHHGRPHRQPSERVVRHARDQRDEHHHHGRLDGRTGIRLHLLVDIRPEEGGAQHPGRQAACSPVARSLVAHCASRGLAGRLRERCDQAATRAKSGCRNAACRCTFPAAPAPAMPSHRNPTISDSNPSLLDRVGRTSVAGRTALVDDGGSWSYADLAAEAAVWRDRLADACCGAGDRVAYLVRPGRSHVAAQLGIWAGGAIAVPLALTHPRRELEYVLDDACPRAVVVDSSLPGADDLAASATARRVEVVALPPPQP
ncbi:MAG: AMP-binding protein, partial [Gemmatimonadetes bacterium]|nr:AMP-binding protein [Gemmatimonadota bacterium]